MIQKESTANVVEVADRIEQVVASFEQQPELAGKVGMEVFFNQAGFIRNSLGQLESTALWGGGLAVLVLFLFLRRVRMTLCVALSIPVSALLALAYTYFTGGTFNVLTMTGLTLALGMLVDNSVVVIESIARMRRQGLGGHQAAVAGVRDVGLAIALATMTTVVVFLPLIFMIGNLRLRVFLAAMGIPLCAALLFSLLVALVFLPVISARILGARPRVVQLPSRVLAYLSGVAVRGLAWALGCVRGAWFGFVVLTHWCVRGTLFVVQPLRYALAVGLVAWFVVEVRGAAGARELVSDLDGFGFRLPGDAGSLQSLVVRGLTVALGVGLLLFGVPRWYARPRRRPATPDAIVPRGTSLLAWVQSANGALLGWTLDHRLLAGVLALIAYQSVSIPTSSMEITSFGEDEDTTELEIDVDLEANFTLEESSDEMAIYEELLEGYRGEFGYKNLIVRFHPGGGELGLRWAERQDPQYLTRLRQRLREELPKLPGHRLRFSREQQLGAATRQYVTFQLRGTDADQLGRYGEQAIAILERVPGLTDVSSSLEEAPEQVRLAFDREAAFSYGVTSQAALQNVSWALRGAQLPRYHEEGREVPFLIEYDEDELAGLDTLRDLTVSSRDKQVALSAFARVDFQPGRRAIWRWNGLTTFNVQARVDDPTRQAALVEVGYDALENELDLPRGFSLGRDESIASQQAQEIADMKRAMLLSIVLVFLLMGILFESLVLPFSVLTTIPFAYLGAMWTLFLTGTAMDSVGWIGIIILVGVVVNNGIVLIDKIHRERQSGLTRREAVLEGAAARVRPILMTAMTTVFGLLPMALGEASRDGIDYRALATCVAGGLTFSTFFTLWIVPLAYTLADDLGLALRSMCARVVSRGRAAVAQRLSGAASGALRAPEDA
jgi:HAE1 family hydrophobic/amphiphilic exporter-1